MLENNTCSGNQRGIRLEDSLKNTVYHNNLAKNKQNALDNGENFWKENYWSDYKGKDANGDGIGDTPYRIPGGKATDNRPLMKPYQPPARA